MLLIPSGASVSMQSGASLCSSVRVWHRVYSDVGAGRSFAPWAWMGLEGLLCVRVVLFRSCECVRSEAGIFPTSIGTLSVDGMEHVM